MWFIYFCFFDNCPTTPSARERQRSKLLGCFAGCISTSLDPRGKVGTGWGKNAQGRQLPRPHLLISEWISVYCTRHILTCMCERMWNHVVEWCIVLRFCLMDSWEFVVIEGSGRCIVEREGLRITDAHLFVSFGNVLEHLIISSFLYGNKQAFIKYTLFLHWNCFSSPTAGQDLLSHNTVIIRALLLKELTDDIFFFSPFLEQGSIWETGLSMPR